MAGGDQTATLARGYWPSYNVPYYAEVYLTSGYAAVLDRLRHEEAAQQQQHASEEDAELAQRLGQLQPFIAVVRAECVGQLAPFGPT